MINRSKHPKPGSVWPRGFGRSPTGDAEQITDLPHNLLSVSECGRKVFEGLFDFSENTPWLATWVPRLEIPPKDMIRSKSVTHSKSN
jgi:hypothetical protein